MVLPSLMIGPRYPTNIDTLMLNCQTYLYVNIEAIKSKFHFCKTEDDRETLMLVLFHTHAKQKLRTLKSYTIIFFTYIIIKFDVIVQMSNSLNIHSQMKLLRKFVLYRKSTFQLFHVLTLL